MSPFINSFFGKNFLRKRDTGVYSIHLFGGKGNVGSKTTYQHMLKNILKPWPKIVKNNSILREKT